MCVYYHPAEMQGFIETDGTPPWCRKSLDDFASSPVTVSSPSKIPKGLVKVLAAWLESSHHLPGDAVEDSGSQHMV
jgi:hypothetical protein